MLIGVSIALLLGQAFVGFVLGHSGLWDLVLSIATTLLVGSAVLNARASGIPGERRHSEAESFSRLLQALSRSVSPNAVVDAIVHELGAATGADHVAVVQMRPGGAVLDVTFVSMLPGSQTSNTVMPIQQLDPGTTRRLLTAPRRSGGGPLTIQGFLHSDESGPLVAPASIGHSKDEHGGHAPRRGLWRHERPPVIDEQAREIEGNARDVANQIASRLRDAYGLRNTLAAPLQEGDSIVGAIVLSRRTDEPWAESAVRVLNSAVGETSAALARVYSHQTAEAEARTDPLTQLPNRRYFDEYCALLASRRRATDRVAILAVDVDHFKRINDMYGHQIGDEVLRAIASGIQTSVRGEDLPSRSGGEEFTVLLRNPAPGVALEIGERIRQTVRELDLVDVGVTDRLTVSVGVASELQAGEQISEIMERADRALYRAKRIGRDRVVEA
jgi:diguanylate cyclase (GGDEF)-like protein